LILQLEINILWHYQLRISSNLNIESGTIYTWGMGEYGQLGRELYHSKENESPQPVPLLSNGVVFHISCGSYFSAVLTKDKDTGSDTPPLDQPIARRKILSIKKDKEGPKTEKTSSHSRSHSSLESLDKNIRIQSPSSRRNDIQTKEYLDYIQTELTKIINREIEILKIEEKLQQEKQILLEQKKNLLKSLSGLTTGTPDG